MFNFVTNLMLLGRIRSVVLQSSLRYQRRKKYFSLQLYGSESWEIFSCIQKNINTYHQIRVSATTRKIFSYTSEFQIQFVYNTHACFAVNSSKIICGYQKQAAEREWERSTCDVACVLSAVWVVRENLHPQWCKQERRRNHNKNGMSGVSAQWKI